MSWVYRFRPVVVSVAEQKSKPSGNQSLSDCHRVASQVALGQGKLGVATARHITVARIHLLVNAILLIG
jgi:hypothetical protein